MSSACVCHTNDWCFFCEMFLPLERKYEQQAIELGQEKQAHDMTKMFFDNLITRSKEIEERMEDKLELAVEALERVAEVELKDYPELGRFIRMRVTTTLEEINRISTEGVTATPDMSEITYNEQFQLKCMTQEYGAELIVSIVKHLAQKGAEGVKPDAVDKFVDEMERVGWKNDEERE